MTNDLIDDSVFFILCTLKIDHTTFLVSALVDIFLKGSICSVSKCHLRMDLLNRNSYVVWVNYVLYMLKVAGVINYFSVVKNIPLFTYCIAEDIVLAFHLLFFSPVIFSFL